MSKKLVERIELLERKIDSYEKRFLALEKVESTHEKMFAVQGKKINDLQTGKQDKV